MDTCVCCGFPVPEGRQVCPICEGKAEPDFITKDGVPVYLKTRENPEGLSPQLRLYELLRRKNDPSRS